MRQTVIRLILRQSFRKLRCELAKSGIIDTVPAHRLAFTAIRTLKTKARGKWILKDEAENYWNKSYAQGRKHMIHTNCINCRITSYGEQHEEMNKIPQPLPAL